MKCALCVLAALSACCHEVQLLFGDQACARQLRAVLLTCFPLAMLGEGTDSCSVEGFILHLYCASFSHCFSSGF